MIGDRYKEARQHGFEAGLSLAKAIQDAGGTIPSPYEMNELTMTEFVCGIAAQNGIRFHFEPPKDNATKEGNDNIKLLLLQRDKTKGDVLVIYEDGRETYITYAEYATIVAKSKAQTPKEHISVNPCKEILLGDPQPVNPWVQVQLMQGLRQSAGKSLYTIREIKLLFDSLEYQAELERALASNNKQQTALDFEMVLATKLIRGTVARGLRNHTLHDSAHQLLYALEAICCRHEDSTLVSAAYAWYKELDETSKKIMDALFAGGGKP